MTPEEVKTHVEKVFVPRFKNCTVTVVNVIFDDGAGLFEAKIKVELLGVLTFFQDIAVNTKGNILGSSYHIATIKQRLGMEYF